MTFAEAIRFTIQEATRFVSPQPVAAEWVMAGVAAISIAALRIKFATPLRDGFVKLANLKRTAVVLCGILPVALRLALLPWIPIPDPSIHDEFSHLLLADTLAHGRLANPTHPMWRHFETIHVIQKPTYSSMYPPVQDSFLALGEVVFHQPWAGVVMSVGVMCAVICWMMQGWLSPAWALYGTLLVILKIGVQGFWMNSFIGGSTPAIAGALLLGSIPRIRAWRGSIWTGALLGLSFALLMNTRPFEGGAMAVVALLYMARPLIRERKRILIPAVVVFTCGALFTGYYNWRVTGSPTHLGYQVNRDTYGWPENLGFLPAKKPEIENPVMRSMYLKEIHHRTIYASAPALLDNLTTRLFENWIVLIGPLLTLPLLFFVMVLRDARTRPLVVFVALFCVLNLLQMVLYPFHLGPVVPALFAVVASGLMHISRLIPERERALAIALPICLVLVGAMKQEAGPLALPLSYWEIVAEPHRDDRAELESWLKQQSGKQLVIVQYEPWHNPDQEWVYNGADLEGSKVVWARSLGPEEDEELVNYFPGRQVWRLNADIRPTRVKPYIPVSQ